MNKCKKCGRNPELVRINVLGRNEQYYAYRCATCGYETLKSDNAEQAAKNWNKDNDKNIKVSENDEKEVKANGKDD